ncbi:helix-turn-helix domain-containing protein [Streptomyces sp. NPDC059957]|uniref:helix-turn-helix domain-containing protein n=1 Tax=unclassified Streptomyces TaxID=2593676 RepID=UPI00365B787F
MEAPPTPPVALGRLLADHELGLRHLAGPAEAELHGVHASEMADPSPYLLGGELLLTAGAGLAVAWPAGGTDNRAGTHAEPPGTDGSPTGAGPVDVPPGRTGAGPTDNGRAHTGRGGAGHPDGGNTGAGHAGGELIDAATYVARLVRAGVGAVGFGVTPVHETVPRALTEACERYGLPLVEVPPGTPFTAVGRSVWRLMARARTAELRRVTEAQQSLAAAAARPDPVPAVLRRLAATLGGWAGLLPTTRPDTPSATTPGPAGAGPAGAGSEPATTAGPTTARPAPTAGAGTVRATLTGAGAGLTGAGAGPAPTSAGTGPAPTGAGAGPAPSSPERPDILTPLTAPGASAGTAPAPEALDVLAELARRVAPGSAVTATAAHGGLHLSVHALGDGRVLALATPTRAPGDHTIASVAAVLLTLLTAHRPVRSEAALTRLLLDGDPGAALGPGPWYAVHARGTGDPRALAAALGTVLLDPRGYSAQGDPVRDDSVGDGSVGAGSVRDGSVRAGSARAGSVRAGSVRLLTDREPTPQPGWRLGVSAAAGPGGLPGADAQAGRALERAEAARTPLARHRDPGLAGLVGAAEARAHAEALLAPLSPALRETLRAWLAHHGSWDRSAAALGIHRNTVRQRIARTADLLRGADLDDPDTRMELWFALRHTDPVGPPGERP